MSERIEIRSGAAITAFVDEYVKRISHVIDEQALAKVEQQLADYGYVKVIRCRDCHMFGDCEWNYENEPMGFCSWGYVLKEGGDD